MTLTPEGYALRSAFEPMRFRQVHLDFHTSEHIEGIGRDFDEDSFIASLKEGCVDTINVFAMCHHGWSYYDTSVGAPHPHLETNLLPRMLEACRKNDIEAPVYITVGFNERSAREHPEWIRVHEDGTPNSPVGEPGDPRPVAWDSWHLMCVGTPYLDYILAYTREVMERFNPVGIWYDIVGVYPCLCGYCRKGMAERGLDAGNAGDRAAYAEEVFLTYLQKTSDLVWSLNPKTRIYHNDCTAKMGNDKFYPYYSHYEIESLPYWGFHQFPFMARYIWPKGLDYAGMTAKFHKSWGEFGGFKNPAQILYESRRMVMLGAKCCFGDQLHPSGVMDPETYRIIGEGYRDVARKEPWLKGARPVSEIGVLSNVAASQSKTHYASDIGAFKVLEETQALFDMIDPSAEFGRYRLLVLPDAVRPDKALADKLNTYLRQGGKLFLTGQSGLSAEADEFVLDIGARYAGLSPWDCTYTKVTNGELLRSGRLVSSPVVNYMPGIQVEPVDAEIWAEAFRPYFNRTMAQFCSHYNTPHAEVIPYPSVIRKGNVVYSAAPLFAQYMEHGMQLHRDLAAACIRQLLPDPLVRIEGLPSAGKISLTRQEESGRLVLHVLYGSPISRGDTQLIEDIPVLHGLKLHVHASAGAVSLRVVPDGALLSTVSTAEGISADLPPLDGHLMVEMSHLS